MPRMICRWLSDERALFSIVRLRGEGEGGGEGGVGGGGGGEPDRTIPALYTKIPQQQMCMITARSEIDTKTSGGIRHPRHAPAEIERDAHVTRGRHHLGRAQQHRPVRENRPVCRSET
jgi:hypothetical protein